MTARPLILFVVTEDWFFCSHFKPMARSALAVGFEVAVACRVRSHGPEIEALGCRVIPVEAERRAFGPLALLAVLRRLHAVCRAERPAIVHLVALKSIMLGGFAARMAGVSRRVMALTGMGYLGAADTSKARLARSAVRAAIRHGIDGPACRYLFENRSDPALLGLDPDNTNKLLIVGGAGVDPAVYPATPVPASPPLWLAVVARMLWSKGIDTAVDAVRMARSRGIDVSLALYGTPDPENPKAIPQSTLDAWNKEPGIRWLGAIAQSEAPRIWSEHHAAVLPSRGGEGLPRTLLEAASCGRAVLTTDVPGCRDFVRDGVTGFVTPPGDAESLADRIAGLAADQALVSRMGAAARERVLSDGYTEAAVGDAVAALYRRMLA